MTYDVTIFGIHLTLNPVAFSIPIGGRSWDVYWYGILIALGFLLALIYAVRNARRFDLDTDRMLDVALVTTPVAILCARGYYVLFDGEKLTGIRDFFGFSDSSGFSGLAIYGGVIGALVTGALMCKLRRVNILDMFDIALLGFLIGQGVGRWGNFVNQEAYGSFTGSSWWGMESNRTAAEYGEGLVHPCFLYESVWCIVGFFVLNKLSHKRRFKGEITLMYGIWYGFGRSIIELLRTDSLMLGGIKISCLLSALACLVCAFLLIYFRKKAVANDNEYTPIFTDTDESESPDSDTSEEETLTEETTEVFEDVQDN